MAARPVSFGVILSDASRFAAAAVLLALAGAAGAQKAEPLAEPALAVSHHRITEHGKVLEYTARVGLMPILDNEAGEVHGHFGFVSYTLDRPAGQEPRPVIFLWNGGPGANSTTVHFAGFGPRRVRSPDDPARPTLTPVPLELYDNDATWLDFADLVFVDPVGTGFARPTKPEYAAEFFNTIGDLASTAEFVRLYLTRFDLLDTPVFLAGESYGTWRASGAAEALEKKGIRVAGVVLISGGIQMGKVSPDAIRTALFVPSRTATAIYHGKLAPELMRDEKATLAQARAWALSEYAPAWQRRDALSDAERTAIVAQLARYTGVDPSIIDRKTLMMTSPEFRSALLRDQNVSLDRYDMRVTRAAAGGRGGGDPMARGSLMMSYIRSDLGFKTSLTYQGVEPADTTIRGGDVGTQWVWNQGTTTMNTGDSSAAQAASASVGSGDGPPGGSQPWLRRAMDRDPKITVFVAAGRYDSLNSCADNDYVVSLLEPRFAANVTTGCYGGGHIMYDTKLARVALEHDVAAYVKKTTAGFAAGGRRAIGGRSVADTLTSGIVTSRGQVNVAGNVLRYTARAGRLPIRTSDVGDAHGNMFFVSYTLDHAPAARARPLTFVWNGGPGSNSGLVHLLGFGPKRIAAATGSTPRFSPWGTALVDNEDTWLAHSDLVFVDPIGTGFSRPTKPEYGAEFYQTRGDAESVAEFIRLYRARFDVSDAPLFIAGESYGVTRAALVTEALERRRTAVSGVILLSGGFPLSETPPALRNALSLPTLTAAAHANQKLPTDLQSRDLLGALHAAESYARGDYATALARRDSLSPAERDAVVAQVARFTGLPAREIDRATLLVTTDQISNTLMAPRPVVVGRYDSRMIGPRDTAATQYDPTTDPSLKDILDAVSVTRYLRNVLGFTSDLFYQGPFGGGYPPPTTFRGDWMSPRWNRGGRTSGTSAAAPPAIPDAGQALRSAMTTNPSLRVLVASGYYDLVSSYYEIEYAGQHLAGGVAPRVTVRSYAGGHAAYTDDAVRRQLRADVAAFVRQASPLPPRR